MNEPRQPIERRKLSDHVRERLLVLIETGELKPGDPMPSERTLMESYGVGRPAVREAMQALQRMGLVDIRHGERAKVAYPSLGLMMDQISASMRHYLVNTPASLEHLKEARATFEMEMARIAARKASSGDVARVRDIVDEQERSAGDSRRFLQLDGRFHREVASVSGNPIWTSLSEALFGWLAHFHFDLVRKPGLEALTLAEHRQIIVAIEARDEKAAAAAMSDHLNRANKLYHQAHYAEQQGSRAKQ